MVGTTTQKRTQFASAERVDEGKIARDSAYFERLPLLGDILNAIPDIFLVANEHRQIIFANYLVMEHLGLHAAQRLVGKRPGEAFGCIHAENDTGGCGTAKACSTCGAIKAVMIGLKGRANEQESRIMLKDGSALDLRVFVRPIEVEGERFAVFTLRDISDEKRRRALERIFFHDLLNTANVISGFLDLLGQSVDPVELESYMEHMRASSDRLIHEINAQRQLTAAENGELKPFYMQVDSSTLLHEVMLQYVRQNIARDRRIEIATHNEAITFVSDHTLLHRVLGNMLKNALEASKPGDVITLCTRPSPDGGVEFRVHNPQTMPERVRLQVFQRSFSTKGPGRGLGTYSIKLLTERYLGGKASFTSDKHGTTFTVRYPLEPPPQELPD